jgi:hypothetical protein
MEQFDTDSLNRAYMSTLRALFRIEVPSFVAPGKGIETLRENLGCFLRAQGIEARRVEMPNLKKALRYTKQGAGVLECTMVNDLTYGAISFDGQFYEHGSAAGFHKYAARKYTCVTFHKQATTGTYNA